MTSSTNRLLEGLLSHDPFETLELHLAEPTRLDAIPGCDTREIDELLLHAQRDGLVSASHRHTGDGSIAHWFTLHLTVRGLRQIGQWPPVGGERVPGPWDEGVWGLEDRPVLRELGDSPGARAFILRPLGGPDAQDLPRWQSVIRLLEAELISGEAQASGLNEVLVTAAGQRALADGHEDPLDRALVDLHRNAKVDAMTAAVEEALVGMLRELAGAHGVVAEDARGRTLGHGALNDQLKAGDVYDESWRAEVAALLALRNETNHGRGATVSPTRIQRAIAGIKEFRETFGDASTRDSGAGPSP